MTDALYRLAVGINSNDLKIPKVKADDASLQSIITAVYFVIGAIALLFVLIGAVRYVISNGDSSSVTGAKNTILYALVGLVLSTVAFAITQLVIYVAAG